MNVPTHAEVIASIDAFQKRHPQIKDARFGREATGEPGLVARLRKGSTPTLRMLERIKAYMIEKDADRHGDLNIADAAAASSGKIEKISASVMS